MILEENWEEYLWCWSFEENKVDDHGDDKEGGTGAVGASNGSWRWWLAAVEVEEEPFLFFIDSAIWWSFCRFQSVESKEEWKRWSLGFVGRDLVKKQRRYEGLGTVVHYHYEEEKIESAQEPRKRDFYSLGYLVIDYKDW